MARISIDKQVLEDLINYLMTKPANIYCEVVQLVNTVQKDAQLIPEEKPEQSVSKPEEPKAQPKAKVESIKKPAPIPPA